MQRLLEGVDFLMEEIERQGLTDKVIVMIGSDFARTPWYNDGNGKDHWSITSMMLMGPVLRVTALLAVPPITSCLSR